MERHIQALAAGGSLAVDTCRPALDAGDPAMMHAALCLLCARSDRASLAAALHAADCRDPNQAAAVITALQLFLPASLHDWLRDFLAATDSQLAAALLRVLGYRRCSLAPMEVQRLAAGSPTAEPLLWLMSRVPESADRGILQHYLESGAGPCRAAAALCLLRLGHRDCLRVCLSEAGRADWPLVPLALGGDRRVLPALLQRIDSPDGCLALGLLGDVAAVPHLVGRVRAEPAAAASLALLTGMTPWEEVSAHAPDDDEGEPAQDYEFQSPPARPLTRRLSEDPKTWEEQWSADHGRFHVGIRYRSGQPFAPAVLLEQLSGELVSPTLRQLAYEELSIRYGIETPFEVDMPVCEQLACIARFDLQRLDVKPGRWD